MMCEIWPRSINETSARVNDRVIDSKLFCTTSIGMRLFWSKIQRADLSETISLKATDLMYVRLW